MYSFRIFLKGKQGRSQKALRDFKAFLELCFKNNYTLDVVDIMTDADLAEADGVLATPTVLKPGPPPKKRVIGDLSNPEMLLMAFGLERDGVSGG